MTARSENEGMGGLGPSLEEKVRFLSVPRHYPGRPNDVQVLETHMSYVFMTSSEVYKLKKPVHNNYFDFSNQRLRRENCIREVDLNRRLAPTTYLGLISLKQRDTAKLQLEGTGRATDWLIQMRRLPASRMLDRLIKRNQLTSGHIDQLGRLLSDFYLHADRIDISPGDYRRRYQTYVENWTESLYNPLYELPNKQLERLGDRLQNFLSQGDTNGFETRSEKVVEAHGDLKPEHICFTEPPEIFDGLEFSRELRCLDPAEEIAFLAIECERLKADQVGSQLFQLYSRFTRDTVPDHHIHFYKAYRCLLRAHLAARHLLDEDVKKPEHWVEQSHSYFNMAEYYAGQL